LNILSALEISKSYNDETILLNQISLGIDQEDKLGVIGINGAGKTTLLKIIGEKEQSDSGKIIKSSGLSIGYMAQNPYFEDDLTIIEQIFKEDSYIMNLLRNYEKTSYDLNKEPNNIKLQKELMVLTEKMDAQKAWSKERELKTILTKLGIVDFNAKIRNLSGGQKKRISLAQALITPTDLLILDEPTNQLDYETITWLEQYLNKRKGALLMVTHDRYFLNRICNGILEVEKGNIYRYKANYEMYCLLKEQREESKQATERKKQSLYKKEEKWMQRGAKARSTKQKARIERFESLKETTIEKNEQEINLNVAKTRMGKKVIELIDIYKQYNNTTLIENFSYTFKKNDRIGIIGPNGSGKTTLLNIIANKVIVDKGIVDIGETIKTGYFMQENVEMNEQITVIDYIKEQGEFLKTKKGLISASSLLEQFLFSQEVQWKMISKLSGGEKRRIYLLKILMNAPNVLLLDEPTNDLDIQTLTILENYLKEFSGVVISVSHDRYFLDKIANRIFVFEKDGEIKQFQGNYSKYHEEVEKQNIKDKINNKTKTSAKQEQRQKQRELKFTYKEQKEFDTIEDIISELEQKLTKINEQIQEVSTNYELLAQKAKIKEQIEKELNVTMERWVYLNEIDAKINQNKKEKRGK